MKYVKFISLTVLLFLSAIPALAERVLVRSGEHQGFTRLVFNLPRKMDWELANKDGVDTLLFPGSSIEFDLKEAFLKITKERLEGLSPRSTKDGIDLALNCACELSGFLNTERMLVIDIRGKPELVPPVTLRPQPRSQDETQETVSSPPVIAPRSTVKLSVPRNTKNNYFPFEARKVARPATLPAVPSSSGSHTIFAAPHDTNTTIERTKRISTAETRLLEQISRAASQGLLTAKLTKPRAMPKTSSHEGTKQLSRDADSSDQVALLKPETPGVNLKAESSADHDYLEMLGNLPQTQSGSKCLTDRQLDLAHWASTETAFGAQIGALRAQLSGEFDRPNSTSARSLAKLYLHFGFGAEAQHVIETSGLSDANSEMLISLSRIIEHGHEATPSQLHGQLACDTHAAFWAVLAHKNLPTDADPNRDAILRALNALPIHLRTHLGPIISSRLISAGEKDTAGLVLRILKRGLEDPDPRVEMADAKVHLADGNLKAASQSLNTVITANTELSPQALISLIDTQLAAHRQVQPDLAKLAGAYAQEYRKEPLGAELQRVHILALSEAAEFEIAFSEIESFAISAAPNDVITLRAHALKMLTKNAKDILFLSLAMSASVGSFDHIEPTVAHDAAARLIDLGFAKYADNYLKPNAEGANKKARRILRAKSALAQDLPRRAEADILGIYDENLSLLRAQIRKMSGDHKTAHTMFASLDHEVQADEQAWLASDWAALSQSDDPVWSAVAAMVMPKHAAVPNDPNDPRSTPLAENGILAQNRALLEESGNSRKTLDSLLQNLVVESSLP